MGKELIHLHGVNKYFTPSSGLFEKKTTVKAVDDVEMTIYEGEIMGLVGESGSGKTTLARLILGLTKPTSNSVIIDGHDIALLKKKEARKISKDIAVVFQDPASNLNPRATVEKSIMRPMLIHGMSRREARERAVQVMEMVKMDPDYLNSYPNQLSGGQQQRIAIARALSLKPKIMILDEPTSALDISVQAQVLNLLLELQEKYNLTYLLISHDINVIRYVCDRVAVMYLGKLVEIGDVNKVTNEPLHPYTRGLMSSVPVIDPYSRTKERQLMVGDIMAGHVTGEGCKFRDRCPYGNEICEMVTPKMKKICEDYYVACHRVANNNR